ncbi:ABC transporter permease [candidate division KSB1 bacterium]
MKHKRLLIFRITEAMLTLNVDRETRFSVMEDLEDRFNIASKKRGVINALISHIFQLFLIIISFSTDNIIGSMVMLRNHIKITFRNIFKNKVFSFINIFGLAVGMAVCILIMLWVQDELSYDRFHANIDNLYRIFERQEYSGQTFYFSDTPGPLAKALKDEFPEVLYSTRILYAGEKTFYYEDKIYTEDGLRYVDPDFLEMFSFKVISGSKSELLRNPFTAVISKDFAEKYFGSDDPIGKVLKIDNKHNITVTGVIENVPRNSHLRFDILVPFINTKELLNTEFTSWGRNWPRTYVLLQKGTDQNAFQSKIKGRIRQENPTSSVTLFVQPVKKIWLYTLTGERAGMTYVYIFSVIAFFVLLIACINFMNLSTARSSLRAREVGLRKVVGAHRKSIIFQFYNESVILAVIALFAAVVLVFIFLPLFNDISGKQMTMNLTGNKYLFISILFTGIFTGILSGSYPALFLSSFHPVKTLRGTIISGSKNSMFRKILVIVQFSLSILLISCSLIVNKQLNFIHSRELGYNKDNIVYIYMRGDSPTRYKPLKTELLSNPDIINVTCTNRLPIYVGNSSSGWDWEGKDPNLSVLMNVRFVDMDYLKTLGITLAEGDNFRREITSGSDGEIEYILNEEAVRKMGMEDPVGKILSTGDQSGPITGIVKDFHFSTLRREIEPLVMIPYPEGAYVILLRVNNSNLSNAVAHIESSWKKLNPLIPFKHDFLDAAIEELYYSEKRVQKLFNYFTFLAIMIACLGLYGLASFMVDRRVKEIGIRKVLGSSMAKIVYIVSREFLVLVIISSAIAGPVAFYFMNKWVQDFAYRTGFGLFIFIFSGLIALFLAMATVSYQALKAANLNPVESLRRE